jgi:hypothetical protein
MDPFADPPSYEEVMNDDEPGPSCATRAPVNRRSNAKAASSQVWSRAYSSSANAVSRLPFASEFRSNSIIGFYRASISDYLLAHSSNDPNPIAYVSTHSLSRPQVKLHSTNSSLSPTIATAEFHTFSNSITIGVPSACVIENLEKKRIFVDTYSIHLVHPTSGIRELFEWRHSSGAQVKALNGKSRGLKLVRTTTGEVIAVYTGAISLKKMGKMKWLSERSYGDVGELIVMMSILALVEKDRRDD